MNNAQLSAARITELKAIAHANNGTLLPEKVVAYARNKKTALHSAFEWDDTMAAHAWRIDQARGLIQVAVEVIHVENEDITVRAFVAPLSVRGDGDEGGYRMTETLLRTRDGRADILATALAELESFQKKYKFLTELMEVFRAADRVRKKI